MNELAEHAIAEVASALNHHWITGEPVPPHLCRTLADKLVDAIDCDVDEPSVPEPTSVLHLVSLAPPLAVVVS